MHRPNATLRAVAIVAALAAFASCTPVDSPTPRVTESFKRAGDVSASSDPVIVAAGDIVCGNNTPAGTACVHAQTASLIGTINPDAVLLLGDNQYEDGTLAEYNALYGPTWGQYKSITYPSVGNHEYQTANASGYFDYFNGVGVQTGRAGDRAKGYYSYDLGAWHLIAINSNCGSVGGCGVGSAQEVWLKADLAAHPSACTVAYWHHPRFSSGQHSDDASTQALWDALYKAKADLILTGHDHNYERFAPMTATGVLDNANGIRSFVVGTGGKEQRALGTTKANSIVRSNNSFGVLKVTLHPTSYDWQFMPIAGSTLNDAGSSACVGVAPTNQSPTAAITSPANGSSAVQGASVSFAGTGTDPEDGTLSGASLVWTSSINGAIGTGASFAKSNLSVGAHTITLTVTDSKGATNAISRSITITQTAPTNQPPVVTITAPVSGSTVVKGSPVTFTGGAIDPEDGVVPASSLIWTIQFGSGSVIGSGNSFTTNALPLGTYTYTLIAKDLQRQSGHTQGTITVVSSAPVNQSPAASISSPANGTSAVQGTSVSFSGSGTDPEDGVLSGASLVWTSNVDGVIGTGTSFSKTNLSVGAHTITLTVTDSKGATNATSRSITITQTAPTNQPPVCTITAPNSGSTVAFGTPVTFTGSAVDPEDGVVPAAMLRWTIQAGSGAVIGSGTSFTTSSLPRGTYTYTLIAKDSKGQSGHVQGTITVF